MKVTLRQLEILRAVVIAGSITKATRLVGLSQPTLSQQIGKMEDALGTQLLVRSRSLNVELTPAGDFWFRTGTELLRRLSESEAHHESFFAGSRRVIRFGTTPSLRGRVASVAARIAIENPDFVRVEFTWSMTSSEVIERMNLHQLNFAVVSETSIAEHSAAYFVTRLFRDPVVWAVPREIPVDVLREALATRTPPASLDHEGLKRYVEVGADIPWHRVSSNWLRTNLPFASPYFKCMTHQAATDLVAANLATCHCPMSLIPSLAEPVARRIRFFDTKVVARTVVLVMPKHLQSINSFAQFYERLRVYVGDEYSRAMNANTLDQLPELEMAT